MATYYVDQTGGNDGNDGLSAGNAWKTLTNVNAGPFNAGDSILFKRGETWTGTLTPPSSGEDGTLITFDVYGTTGEATITGGSYYSLDTNTKNYIIFNNLHFKNKQAYVNASSNITFNYALFSDVLDTTGNRGVYGNNSPTLVFNNCIFYRNHYQGLRVAGTTSVTMRNCIFSGNGKGWAFAFQVDGAATIDYDYCLVNGNNYNPQSCYPTGAAYTDGGHNLHKQLFKPISYSNGNSYFVLSCDDDDVDFWKELDTALDINCTFFATAGRITEAEETDLANLASAGHEIAIHNWSHSDLSKTQAFDITSTNTTPTCNVDIANSQIILWCDEAENRVTVDWSSVDKSISDLVSAVSGKGWTITKKTNIMNELKLASLADSSGAQAVSYTTNLDVSAPNYAFWREEVLDAKDWIATKTGVTPTTISYPWGNRTDNLMTYLKDVAILEGARVADSTEADAGTYLLKSIKIYEIQAKNNLPKGDGTEAAIRANARNIYEFSQQMGAVYIVYTHNAAEMTAQQVTWYVDEIQICGGIFNTFGEVVTAIRASHSTANGLTYTKTYSDLSDFNLQSTSPCIDAGTDVGLTQDYAGNTVPMPTGGNPDIGVYEYLYYLLTVLKSGTGTGTITSDPAGINYGADNTEEFKSGAAIELTATPGVVSKFTGWTGDLVSSTNPDTITMDSAKTVTAVLTLLALGHGLDLGLDLRL